MLEYIIEVIIWTTVLYAFLQIMQKLIKHFIEPKEISKKNKNLP